MAKRQPWAAMVVMICLAGSLGLISGNPRVDVGRRLGGLRRVLAQVGSTLWEEIEACYEAHAAASNRLTVYEQPPWRWATLAEAAASRLAGSGGLTLSELRDSLKDCRPQALPQSVAITAAALERVMRDHPAFVREPGNRWYLGHPLADFRSQPGRLASPSSTSP